ncbi:MAG: Ig-like domain-containing protein [Firmicutes bacterium]|nr:Ig-like domain-containing protein [Bacillota bacterium]
MKKAPRILCMMLLMVMLMTGASFAAGLQVTGISPKDGKTGMQISNMAIKFTFSEDMIGPNVDQNSSRFKITDPEGNEIPFQMVYSEEKYPDQLWLILEGELVADTEYTCTVSSGVVSKSGNVLENGLKTGFKTRNTKIDNWISMGLMMGMMGFMFFATTKAAKKAQEEQGGDAGNDGAKQYNPYKMAKEKGISVDEARQIIAKEKEKDARKAAKAAENKRARDEAMAAEVEEARKRLEEEYEAARHAANYHVKGPRSIKDAGYKVPRSVVRQNRAKREARKAAEKARAKKK